MNVRPARPEDLSWVQKILIECDLARDQDLSEFTGVCLVCVRGGEVIGFAQALPGKPMAYFSLLAVLPVYQKTRAAYKLVEGMELMLRSMGCKEWCAYVRGCDGAWQKTIEAWGGVALPDPGQMLRKDLA